MTALERRYRRLLAWYPAGHRREYGEEIIGVLMASAPPGRNRPPTGEVLGLVVGGLRARLMRARTGEGNPAWRDALAVFSVVAPVVLLGWYPAIIIEWRTAPPLYSQRFAGSESALGAGLLTMLIATAVLVAVLAVWPMLARRGGLANTITRLIAVAAVLADLAAAYRFFGAPGNAFTLGVSLIAALEILALVASPGPARGWQLLSRRGVIVLAVISVVVIAAGPASGTRRDYSNLNVILSNLNVILDVSGVVTVLGVALTLRWPVGSRLMALWAIPGYQVLGFTAAQYLSTGLQSSWAALQVEFRLLPTAIIAAVVGLTSWRSSRRTGRQTTDPPADKVT